MSGKKEIGQHLKKRLTGLQQAPDPAVFEHVMNALPERKRRKVPFWFFILGGLLLFSGGLFTGIKYTTSNHIPSSLKKGVDHVSQPIKTKKLNTTTSTVVSDTINTTMTPGVVHSTTDINLKSKSSKRPVKITSASSKLTKQTRSTGYKIAAPKPKDQKLQEKRDLPTYLTKQDVSVSIKKDPIYHSYDDPWGSDEMIAIDSLTQSITTTDEDKNEEKTTVKDISPQLSDSKWSVTLQGMADYYFNTGSANSISPGLDGYKQSLDVHLNYGFTLNFNATSKIQLRIGASNQVFDQTYKNINAQDISFSSLTHVGLSINENDYNALINNSSDISITQSYQYFNIPVELRYQFLNKKIRLSAIGGFNYSGLVKNEVILDNSLETLKIGSNNKIENFTWGVHAGIGSRYPLLGDSFYLNTDLIINYQPFTYLDIDDSNPAIIGARLGLEYKF